MLLDTNRKRTETERSLWRIQPSKQHDAKALFDPSENTTLEDIQAAYRNLCKQYHPDNRGSAEAFIQLQESYDMLMTTHRAN